MLIIKYYLFWLLFVLGACAEPQKQNQVSSKDTEQIHALHENYRTFWLENDSTKVVNLFAEHAALIPPQNPGDLVRGKSAIGQWWFAVNNDTTYPITGFEYQQDSLIIVDSQSAIWEGLSTVSWNTVVGDSIVSSSQSSSNFITVCTKIDGEWKILRQIWNVRG
jgi:ketosteroid isomerase-like protein